jgi:hypothetical protein
VTPLLNISNKECGGSLYFVQIDKNMELEKSVGTFLE